MMDFEVDQVRMLQCDAAQYRSRAEELRTVADEMNDGGLQRSR
jgi:hypothetical protein